MPKNCSLSLEYCKTRSCTRQWQFRCHESLVTKALGKSMVAMCMLMIEVTLPKCKYVQMLHEYISNSFPLSSQMRIYEMSLVHKTVVASPRPRTFGPITSLFPDPSFNLFPMQTILQMHLEIVHTRLRTWSVQLSRTVKTFDPWVIHEFCIGRRRLIGAMWPKANGHVRGNRDSSVPHRTFEEVVRIGELKLR